MAHALRGHPGRTALGDEGFGSDPSSSVRPTVVTQRTLAELTETVLAIPLGLGGLCWGPRDLTWVCPTGGGWQERVQEQAMVLPTRVKGCSFLAGPALVQGPLLYLWLSWLHLC